MCRTAHPRVTGGVTVRGARTRTIVEEEAQNYKKGHKKHKKEKKRKNVGLIVIH